MDGNIEKDMGGGWEDVGIGAKSAADGGAAGGAFGAPLGQDMAANFGDAVTTAVVSHWAKELSKGSMSLFPQVIEVARRYFNVTHGYVLRKCLWQLVPMPGSKRKSTDGELGAEKDWTTRMCEGLEVDIEEPDLYIPTMSFVTYVLLCGVIRGLQDKFHPDVLSATITYATALLIVETAIFKGVLFTAGAINAPTLDLAALLSYKFFYLSLHMMVGLFIGFGYRPTGFIYHLAALALVAACGLALLFAFRRLARMQPSVGQECVTDVHKFVVKALPAAQLLVYYMLLPSWPAAKVHHSAAAAAGPESAAEAAAEAVVITTTTTLAAAIAKVAEAAAAGAAAAVAAP